jgi:Trypsin
MGYAAVSTGRAMLRAGVLLAGLAVPFGPASAILDGHVIEPDEGARSWMALIENEAGRVCSAVLISPQKLLTAAHCTTGGMRLTARMAGRGKGTAPEALTVVEIVRHPSFKPDLQPRLQTGVDLAVIRIAGELPAEAERIEMEPNDIAVGTKLAIFGFGVAAEGRTDSARVLRGAVVEHVGRYRHSSGATAMFAKDPASAAEQRGRSACSGDSGGAITLGPQHKASLIGILSWSTGPGANTRCGGFTAYVPLSDHYDWVVETVEAMSRRQRLPRPPG